MKLKLIAATMGLALLATGCSTGQNAAGGRANQRAVPVEVKKAVTEEFSLVTSLSGRLEAKEQVELTPKAAGRIKQTLVKVGDVVKAGQAIAQLDEAEGSVQLQRSQATLMLAKARYEETNSGTRLESLVQTQNLLADLQNKYESTKKELERTEALYKEGAVSSDQVEKVKVQLVSATTSLENQKQKLKIDQEGPTKSAVDVAVAQMKQAEADYTLAQLAYENLIIKAPIDGVIGSLPVAVGDAVTSNTVVAQIINMSAMNVKANVSESQVGLFQNDQTVDVKITSIGLTTKGKITSISPLADSSKSYPIEVRIPNAELRAKAGMTASLEIKGQPRKALVVRREAVIAKDRQFYVYVVEAEKAKQVKVDVGESDGERMEILSGLAGGEEVVVKGQNTLVAGASVVIFDPSKPQKQDQKAQQKR